jgi:two-component system, NarL family, sensor kinase
MDAPLGPEPVAPRRWLTVLAVLVTLSVCLTLAAMLLRGRPPQVVYDRWLFHTAPIGIFSAWMARALLPRASTRWFGRAFLLVAVMIALHSPATALADATLAAAGIEDTQGDLFVPAELARPGAWALFLASWLWLFGPVLALPYLLVRFPDGQLPDPRWRVVMPLAAAGLVGAAVGHGIGTWPGSPHPVRMVDAPAATPVSAGFLVVGLALVLASLVLAVASMVARWRTASPTERRQIRMVSTPAAALMLVTAVLWPWPTAWSAAQMAAVLWLLVAYTVAVLRYRLHQFDVVVNRTVAGSVLAALVTGSYLAVVVGVGSLVGRNAEHPLLPLLAAGLVAVLFEPARRRVRRVVDRLLYGRDADAYEVLSDLAHQLRDAGSLDRFTEHVTQLIVRSTGATGAEVHTVTDGERRSVAAHGNVGTEDPVLRVPVLHDGEQLGEVVLHARSPGDLAPDAPELLDAVAGPLGAVLRNALLTAALHDQVEQLRRSRQRLVTAQDAARRELERDIHDGAQARLVALRLQLGLAGAHAAALPDDETTERVRVALARCGQETDVAIRSLRDLSRGLHPPVLGTDGVAAALRTASRGLPLDVVVTADGVDRFEPQVEAAVYFSCLEAIKNSATHAQATTVRVTLEHVDGTLRFTVADDGRGFDPEAVTPGRGTANLADRVAGLGGTLHLDSAPDRGTRIVGQLPATPLEPAGTTPSDAGAAAAAPVPAQPLVADR